MAGAFEQDDEITSINVTPLVDIVLVLLIIFMVTTRLITNQEALGISKPEAATGRTVDAASVLVSCQADGTISLDDVVYREDAALKAAIAARVSGDATLQGVVQCDEKASVGTMVHLIDILREAGVKKYAIATRQPKVAS